MTRHTDSGTGPVQDEIYRCLAHHRRRRILGVLTERPSLFTDTALATRIAADESASSLVDGATETESVLLDLRHVQLPMLENAGLVEWDRDSRTVTGTLGSGLEEDAMATHLERLDPDWDDVVSALTHRRRRLALSIASDRGDSLGIRDLARAVAEREAGSNAGTVSDAATKRVLTTLHHEHVPMLERAGLLEYDTDGELVTYRGRDAIELERFDGELEESRAPLVPVPL